MSFFRWSLRKIMYSYRIIYYICLLNILEETSIFDMQLLIRKLYSLQKAQPIKHFETRTKIKGKHGETARRKGKMWLLVSWRQLIT